MDSINPLVASAVAAAIPLMLAALGELVTERSGVLNLGVEGMMLVGAVAAFAAVAHGGGLGLAVLAGVLAGSLAALAFGVLTISLQASQVATGLALTILGTGISAFLGRSYVGSRAAASFEELPIPGLSALPLVGPFFSLTLLGYVAVAMLVAITWFLFRTRGGLVVRTVGESPAVARSLGMRVSRIRYAATLFGGAMAGLATWRPVRVAIGALLFGGVTALGLYLQTVGIHISAFALASLPYLATVAVLVATSSNQLALRRNAPASLGKPFFDGD